MSVLEISLIEYSYYYAVDSSQSTSSAYFKQKKGFTFQIFNSNTIQYIWLFLN